MGINDKPDNNSIQCKNGSDEYKYVTALIDTFGQNKMPKEFDSWTVQEQCNWINRNLDKFFPNVPKSLLNFPWAAYQQLHYDRPQDELPRWMDMDKYRRGQRFVQKNYATVITSKIFGITYFFSFEEKVKTLIAMGHVHTPYLIFRRYLTIITEIMSWYNDDPWTEGTQAYKNMQIARRMHKATRNKMCQLSDQQIDTMTTLTNPWPLDYEPLLKDLAAICPFEKVGQRPDLILNKPAYRAKGINNADMAVVQCVITVLILLYPENIGAHDVTDEDIEAFCHVWRCYGYFLGIDDEHNFHRGTLDEIKQRARDFCQCWTMPNLKDMISKWQYLTRCLTASLNYYPLIYLPYNTMILLAIESLNLNMLNLYSSLSYIEWIAYKIIKYIFRAMKFSSVRTVVNNIIRKMYYTAENYDTKKWKKLHENSNKQVPDFSLMYNNE